MTIFDFWSDEAIQQIAGLIILNGGSTEIPALGTLGFAKIAFFNGFRTGWSMCGNATQMAALDAKIQAAIVKLQNEERRQQGVEIPTEKQTADLLRKPKTK